jgi:hypothetical protein
MSGAEISGRHGSGGGAFFKAEFTGYDEAGPPAPSTSSSSRPAPGGGGIIPNHIA